jgi:hypothetical protein
MKHIRNIEETACAATATTGVDITRKRGVHFCLLGLFRRLFMKFGKLGIALLGLFVFTKAIQKIKGLDKIFTPGLVKGNAPAPGRKGKFKANQRKERKAGEKKRTIEAHKAGAQKNKTKEKAKREKVKREKRLKKY